MIDWKKIYQEFMDEVKSMYGDQELDPDCIYELLEEILLENDLKVIKKYQNPYDILGYNIAGYVSNECHGVVRTDTEYDDYEEVIIATWHVGDLRLTISELKLGYNVAYKIYKWKS